MGKHAKKEKGKETKTPRTLSQKPLLKQGSYEKCTSEPRIKAEYLFCNVPCEIDGSDNLVRKSHLVYCTALTWAFFFWSKHPLTLFLFLSLSLAISARERRYVSSYTEGPLKAHSGSGQEKRKEGKGEAG